MKTSSHFTKIIAGLVLLIIPGIIVVIFIGRTRPLAAPTFDKAGSKDVSMTAGLTLIFSEEMDSKSVESRITSTPPLPFLFTWEGRKLILTPKLTFPPGANVTLILSVGAKSADGRYYSEDHKWSFQVRSPRIIYLGEATTSPEVWISEPEKMLVRPISRTGGKITGFSPFPDGSAILITKKNDQGGSDIYSLLADGTGEQIVVNCGKDTCRDAVVDKAATRIAFSRNQNPASSEPSKKFYLYTIELISGTILPLYPDGVTQGVSPNWSPDGKKIAFYDPNALGIRIRDFDGNNDFLLGTSREQSGSWSPDSNKFIFVDDIIDNSLPYSNLYEVDIQTSSVSQLLRDKNGSEEYGSPVWSPDGKTVAMGVRQIDSGVTKQIWLFDFQENTRKVITTNPTYINAAPQWKPDGNAIVFQQAQLGASGIKPSVIVWDKIKDTFETITSDGALPAWLP